MLQNLSKLSAAGIAGSSLTPIRLASAAAATSPRTTDKSGELTQQTTKQGLHLACIPQFSPIPVTRLVAAFNAGPRQESGSELGISHLIRRACGLSSPDVTAINLTRHLQQMGASLECTSTREQLIYSVEVAPNLAKYAGELLGHAVTRPAFYQWEIKDVANKLMQTDINLLNRRHFDQLALELIHEAAYRTTLGRSLYANEHKVGSFSLEQLEHYLATHFTLEQSVVVGLGIEMGPLTKLSEHLAVRPPKAGKGEPAKFVGGEIRRFLPIDTTYAILAFEGAALGSPESLAFSLFARALSPLGHRVSYSDCRTSAPRLAKALSSIGDADEKVAVGLFSLPYSDSGLVGLEVVGPKSAVCAGMRALKAELVNKVAKEGIQEAELKKAKALLKTDILLNAESAANVAQDVAVQLLCNGKYVSPAELVSRVDAVTLDQVNQAIKKSLTANRAALAVVGDTSAVPPLSVLMS